MKESVWVLTETYNDYNQHGAYFIKVWKNKPTVEQLQEVTGHSKELCEKLFNEGFNEEGYDLEEHEI